MDSVVKHTPNTFYLELRQDYIMMCQACTYRKSDKSKSSPHCKALILAIMERWTNDKVSKGKDAFIAMTYQQWIEGMYGIFGRNSIIDSLDELIHENILQRAAYKVRGGRDQYRYLLNYVEVNKRLKPSFTNQSCDESNRLQVNGDSGKVNDDGLQVNPQTFTNQSLPRSQSLINQPFVDRKIQDIDSNKESTLTPDLHAWYQDIFCLSKMGTSWPLNEKFKGYFSKLMEDITTVEQLNDLYDYAKPLVPGDGKVKPGNLVKCQPDWKQERVKASDEVQNELLYWFGHLGAQDRAQEYCTRVQSLPGLSKATIETAGFETCMEERENPVEDFLERICKACKQ